MLLPATATSLSPSCSASISAQSKQISVPQSSVLKKIYIGREGRGTHALLCMCCAWISILTRTDHKEFVPCELNIWQSRAVNSDVEAKITASFLMPIISLTWWWPEFDVKWHLCGCNSVFELLESWNLQVVNTENLTTPKHNQKLTSQAANWYCLVQKRTHIPDRHFESFHSLQQVTFYQCLDLCRSLWRGGPPKKWCPNLTLRKNGLQSRELLPQTRKTRSSQYRRENQDLGQHGTIQFGGQRGTNRSTPIKTRLSAP